MVFEFVDKMRRGVIRFQIGKSGVTDNFIETLKSAFKKNRQIRVSVLKSAISERKNIKEIAENIVKKLKGRFIYRTIGFTIILIKIGEILVPESSVKKRYN